MKATIAVLPGDGIGPEVVAKSVELLSAIAAKYGHDLRFVEGLIGGIAIDATGDPLPAATIEICEKADAILLGAVGGPKWSDPTATVQPERGLLELRQRFGLFANLRPVKTYPALVEHAPLRAELLQDVDILFVRELVSGIYFGERQEQGDGDTSYDTMSYSRAEVEQVAAVAFRAAQGRRKTLCSVDKANVLATMRLWRRTIVDVHEEYSDVELEHLLVDAATMHLLTRPSSFDVIVAGNMFGDILSDEASVLAGSLGMLPSASLRADQFGLYEPVHGSAPDIAGQGKANPVGMFLSAAMLLRYSLGLDDEARAIESAIDAALDAGLRTADIASPGQASVSTDEFAAAVIQRL
ncbi:MAG: 3-isopropylmalate dehydrogenase [Chloroflexi bacterium]|nr:3-isopropylmalate dehydrogenase [Chloroflexota bacterium]